MNPASKKETLSSVSQILESPNFHLILQMSLYQTASINLCPDKDAVYEEILRVLKPGGRLAISDIVLTKDIDSPLRERFQATWAGCLGGAMLEESFWDTMRKVGFTEFQMVSRHTLTPIELKAMACCPGEEFTPPPNNEDLEIVQGKVDSVKFTAKNPPPA